MVFAAYFFMGISLIVIAFQIALALGAPWGEFTMGGKISGILPPLLRLAAFLQSLLILFFNVIVLSRAQLGFENLYTISRTAIWFVFGFFVLGSVMNLVTPSKKERMLWAPVNILLLVLSLLIALG